MRIHGRNKNGRLKGCESIWVNRCRETGGGWRTGKAIILQNNFQPCLRRTLRLCFEEGMSSTVTASHSLAPLPAGCRCCLVTSARQAVSYRGLRALGLLVLLVSCSNVGKSWSPHVLLGTDAGLQPVCGCALQREFPWPEEIFPLPPGLLGGPSFVSEVFIRCFSHC